MKPRPFALGSKVSLGRVVTLRQQRKRLGVRVITPGMGRVTTSFQQSIGPTGLNGNHKENDMYGTGKGKKKKKPMAAKPKPLKKRK